MDEEERITRLDLSLPRTPEVLDAHPIYRGLAVELLAGKPTLVTPAEEAIPVLAANAEALSYDPAEVTLTGPMAIWAYLVVFHVLHGRTKRIYFEDPRQGRILVAAHG
jgi:hypothetical protein